jgi:hypothetical protein
MALKNSKVVVAVVTVYSDGTVRVKRVRYGKGRYGKGRYA